MMFESEGEGVTHYALALRRLGEDAAELDGVHARVLAVLAVGVSPPRDLRVECQGITVGRCPLGDDVGDDPPVVVGVDIERLVGSGGEIMRCIQTSRVNPISNR